MTILTVLAFERPAGRPIQAAAACVAVLRGASPVASPETLLVSPARRLGSGRARNRFGTGEG